MAATLLIVSERAAGQQTGNTHSFSVGTTDYTLDDATVYPFTAKDKTISFGYDFLKQTQKRKTGLSFLWQQGNFNKGDNRINLNSASFRVSDGFLVFKSRDRRLKGYAGYSINLNPSYGKIENKTSSYYTWSTINTLDFYQSYNYSWKKNNLSLDIYLPLIGAVSRPEAHSVYPTDMNGVLYASYSNLDLASWHNYKAVSLSLDYRRTLSQRWQLFAGLRYRYSELETELPVSQRSAGIQAGVSLTIK